MREPRTYIPKYERDDNKGILYVTEIGRLQVTAHYNFPTIEIRDSAHVLTDVNIQYLDLQRDELYIELLLGMFLQAIGRSRRSFLLEGNPIVLDSDAMVNEGKEIYAEAKQRLEETSLWYMSLGQ